MVDPHALTDMKPLLERLKLAFGARPLGYLLDITPDAAARCVNGKQIMNNEMKKQVISLHNLLAACCTLCAGCCRSMAYWKRAAP